jgi:hypothetical protein
MARASLVAFACTSLVLLGCDRGLPTAPASLRPQFATTKVNEWQPIDQDFTSNCTGETFHITGKAHVVQTTSTDANGTTIIDVHINTADIQGTSLDGTKYIVTENAKESETMTFAPDVTDIYAVVRLHVISQGSLDNWFIVQTVHEHFAPPAPPVITVTTTDECRG